MKMYENRITSMEFFFEGVWALHTTVIIAADQREVGNLLRIRAPKILTRPILLKWFVFQEIYRNAWASRRFFTKSLKRRALAAVARLVPIEIVASETPERRRSTFLENVCFCANEKLDFIDFRFR